MLKENICHFVKKSSSRKQKQLLNGKNARVILKAPSHDLVRCIIPRGHVYSRLPMINMNIFAPVPYPDELLYSTIARYALNIGARNASLVLKNIVDSNTGMCVDLPNRLYEVSRRTWVTWRLTGEEIADKLTLYPYYARYLNIDRSYNSLKTLLDGSGAGIKAQLGITTCKVTPPRFLRYCTKCRQDDKARYGETYWRRSHQLTGVIICPDHVTQLLNSAVPLNTRNRLIAAEVVEARKNEAKWSLSEREIEKLLAIARRCRDMLMGSLPNWTDSITTDIYKKSAVSIGLIEGPVQFSPGKAEQAFLRFYGKNILVKMNCDFKLGHNASWFRNIFRAYRKSFHPLQHALVQIFLESVNFQTKITALIGSGPWKCPNHLGRHSEEFPITNPLIYIGQKHRKIVASVKCSCGFSFTFQKVNDTDPRMPIVSSVMNYGPAWQAETVRLRNLGLSVLAISKKTGITDKSVVKLLCNKSHVYSATPEKIEKWRKEWTRLLATMSNSSRLKACNKNRGLYLRLWRHDRDWLFSTPRQWNHNPVRQCRVDWGKRDKDWSVRIQSAANAIAHLLPTKKITQAAVLIELEIKGKALMNLHRLPLCRAALNECVESKESYGCRRLITTAKKAKQDGVTLYPSVLLRLASLKRAHLTVNQKALLDELTCSVQKMNKTLGGK